MKDQCVRPRHPESAGSNSQGVQIPGFSRGLILLVGCVACALAFSIVTPAQEMSNDTLRLRLDVTAEGIPVIQEAIWKSDGRTAFRDRGTPDGLRAWVPAVLLPLSPTVPSAWNIREGPDFITAESTRELANRVRITWIVELPKQGQLFRLRVRIVNGGKKARAVDWFPVWSGRWDLAGPALWARWWQALEYKCIEQDLTASPIQLGSRLHSSDDEGGGVNPYWVVGGQSGRVYFGLQWCGGWNTSIARLGDGFTFSAGLPSEETQLVLGRGETIEGPALLVTPVRDTDETFNRAVWMRQRHALGQTLYAGPPVSFPLSYNHWYAIRRQVDDTFLNRQIAAMTPYGFDAVVLDAGWFAEGRWKPDPQKFQPGEMAQMMASLKARGIKPGLWTTPQYVSKTAGPSTLRIEDPPVFSKFISGYLVDMAEAGFQDYVTDHVLKLRRNYSMDYWKYDQPFFTSQTRSGTMRNVIGLQQAIQAVRLGNPDLTIENCQDGGRMINEFTLLAAQASWLKDAGPSGIGDPRDNISVALNALQFVFPWAALRFTINLDRMDPEDDELTRLYCRSAMAGIWGMSTDLSRISDRQRSVILTEIANYRRLNMVKDFCLYDLQQPDEGADTAGVTFYGNGRLAAGVLLYRWQRSGAFESRVVLPSLKQSLTYHIVDADLGIETSATGGELTSSGLAVPFSSGRLSALLFIEAVTEAVKAP